MQQQTAEHAAAMRLAASGTDFQTLHEIVAKARQNLSQNDWDYIVGGAETETTLRRNRHALDSIAFRPRVLRDVSHIDTSVDVLGRKIRLPVFFAPVGSLECFHREAAADVVRAAGEFGVGHMLSSMCAETTPGSTSTSLARSTAATLRSASRSTPRSTAAASATSPSATWSPA